MGFDALRRQVPVRYSVQWRQGGAKAQNRRKPPYIMEQPEAMGTNIVGWVTASVVWHAGVGVNTLSGLRRSLKL